MSFTYSLLHARVLNRCLLNVQDVVHHIKRKRKEITFRLLEPVFKTGGHIFSKIVLSYFANATIIDAFYCRMPTYCCSFNLNSAKLITLHTPHCINQETTFFVFRYVCASYKYSLKSVLYILMGPVFYVYQFCARCVCFR